MYLKARSIERKKILIYEKVYTNQTKEDYSEIIIIFNGKHFCINKYSDTSDYYNEDEYLPGIHINIEKRYSDNEIKKIREEFKESYNIIRKIFLLYKLYKINKNQSLKVILEINNKRDDITILDGENTIFENRRKYQDPLNEKFKSSSNEYYFETKNPVFKNVDTSRIMYPFQSGGWGNRCIMKQIFGDLGLFNTYNNKYKFFEENEMHFAVSQIDYLMEICSSKGACSKLLKRFKAGTYIVSDEDKWHDDICLEEKNNVYRIINGNHRSCCARMFGIPTIKARVSFTYPYEEKSSSKYKNDIKGYSRTRYDTNKGELTKDYYETLFKLGLNKREAYDILDKGISGKNLIDYIEICTDKSLLELYEQINK